MKIRIKGNSIRLRLTKSEVKTLSETGSFEEYTRFATGEFRYKLEAKENLSQMDARLENNTICIYLSKKLSVGWYDAPTVGFQHDLPLEDGNVLSLLVEKDFVCLDETTEDQSDNYPHPLEAKLK